MAPKPDIPAAKRAGLPVDIRRLRAEGSGWLTPEERYALKTHGICTQSDPDRFMVRVRTLAELDAATVRGLADLAERHAAGWVHLTTRQQLELHHVPAREVESVVAGVEELGLTTRSACGHTVRGVMWCPAAPTGLDEPFDCSADARRVAGHLLARTPELDIRLPSRVNIAFGGCAACREHALLNEAGFVSTVVDGRLGYELWIGGSLGRSQPTLAVLGVPFVAREDLLAAVDALVTVYLEYGDFDRPARARMKYLLRELGEEDLVLCLQAAFSAARRSTAPDPLPVHASIDADLPAVLGTLPPGGWRTGVRPERTPGSAFVTINVPLGDLDAAELRGLAAAAERHAGGRLLLTRNQNIALAGVPHSAIPDLEDDVADTGFALEGSDLATDVRACTGAPVCALAITPSARAGDDLASATSLARNAGLRVSVSGCPNACAQHQVADLGFSGGRVTVGGAQRDGYQVWLGADLAERRIGEVVGRVAAEDLVAVTDAIVSLWEAVRAPGEPLGRTVARVGAAAFGAHLTAVFDERWSEGAEPDDTAGDRPGAELLTIRPLEVAS